MSDHTEGPWAFGTPIDDDENGGQYRTLRGPQTWIGDIRANSKEDDANIRLIAAVTDLLVACEAMVHAAKMNDPAMGGVAATLAAAAIAKTSEDFAEPQTEGQDDG